MDSPIKPVDITTQYVPLDKVDQEHQERRRRKGRHRDTLLEDMAAEPEPDVTAELSSVAEASTATEDTPPVEKPSDRPVPKRDAEDHIDLTA